MTRTNLEHFANEEWYTYLTFIVKSISQNEVAKESLAPLFEVLEKNCTSAGEALEIVRTSRWSREVDEADLLRDRLIGSTNNYIRSFLYDTDPAKQRAAENLIPVISHYGDMSKAPQDKESGMIINFLNELEQNYSADVAAIALKDRLDQLKTANSRFIDALDKRTAEAGSRTLSIMEIRREGNRLIRLLYAQIEILLLTAPNDAITQFANELNAENVRVNGNLNRRGTGKKKEEEV